MVDSWVMPTQTKSAEIRQLARQGKTAREIVRLGFRRATVYDALRRRRMPEQRMIEECHTMLIELLRLVRGTEITDV